MTYRYSLLTSNGTSKMFSVTIVEDRATIVNLPDNFQKEIDINSARHYVGKKVAEGYRLVRNRLVCIG